MHQKKHMTRMTKFLHYHFNFGIAWQWLVIASVLDFMLTFVILGLGGLEVNPTALAVIQSGGFQLLIIYKFSLLCIIITICEGLRKRDEAKSQMLVRLALMVWFIPPAFASLQIFLLILTLS